jgi:predicted site-specific integrase-resolvase
MTIERIESLLTEREAAARLGYSVYSLREFRRRGLIEYFRFNSRTIKYAPSHLEAFKREHLQVRHT